MDRYIPKYIRQLLAYRKGESITHEDFNAILNLLVTASDYNTEQLDAIFNNDESDLVINAKHAEQADAATNASNSDKLANAVLSRSTSPLEEDDNKIPSSKQVKNYIDSLQVSNNTTFNLIASDITSIKSKNDEQDNRLNTLDIYKNQHSTLISNLENRVTNNEQAITGVRADNIAQDTTLSQHDQRITNLELGEVPSDVLRTLMTKGGYAVNTGTVDEHGEPIYSPDTVKKAQTALSLLVNNTEVPANSFALNSDVVALQDNSFIIRGNLPNPVNAVVEMYTLGDIRRLKHGAYGVTAEQAAMLNLDNAQAGTIRIYPCVGGTSLEYEVQAGLRIGETFTAFIPASGSDSTTFDNVFWINLFTVLETYAEDIQNLQNQKLTTSQLNVGADLAIAKSGTAATIVSTAPRIVISSTQPTADPDRETLWIQI